MIKVSYAIEPRELRDFNLDPLLLNDYEEMVSRVGDVVKTKLLQNQGYLCAYCMCSLKDDHTTSIEHIYPKGNILYKHKATQMANFLAVCNNIHNHCDKSKGEHELEKVDTLIRGNIENYIIYNNSGVMSSIDSKIDNDIKQKKRLNLNCDILVSRRLAVIKAIEEEVIKIKRRRIRVRNNFFNQYQNITMNKQAYCGLKAYIMKKIESFF